MAFSIRNLKIRQQILLVTIPPLFVLLCAIALLFYAYWMALHANRGTRRSLESIAQSEELLRHVGEMYMGVRGFIFTQQASALTLGPYVSISYVRHSANACSSASVAAGASPRAR